MRTRSKLKRSFALADVGLKLRDESLESDAALISDPVAAAAQSVAAQLGITATPVFTYLANTIRIGNREIPYSLVTAMGDSPPALNEWAARDLGAKVGDKITIEYFVWKDEGRLATETAEFTLGAIVPTQDQRDLAPEYPGHVERRQPAGLGSAFPRRSAARASAR